MRFDHNSAALSKWKSHSPWSSNIVLARRKDGRLRLCTDFRQLNARTIKDSYALPRVEEILDCLSGSQYFSVLDMKSGYYRAELEESHKERTAFTVGPLGFYEYNRLPFGLTNSPAMYNDSWKISWETTICRYVSYTWTTSSSSHVPMKNMWTG